MKARAYPRWVFSLADMMMLLLGFFVLLVAGDAADVAAGARTAFSSEPERPALIATDAANLFEPGEARLRPGARQRVTGIGSAVSQSGRTLVVESHGRDRGARRFDGWELSAARAAAIARALEKAGMAEDKVLVVMPGTGLEEARGQRLTVRYGG
jgi:flagellar motor protein MotB